MNLITQNNFNKETDMLDQVCEHLKDNPEEHEEEFCCHDCSKMFLRSDMDIWTPYGRDLAQGDEPIYICLDCTLADKHQQRIERYERYLEEEYGPGGRSLIRFY